ncbi:hypothetical protein AX16_000924 [Volvariella volvacea WC 439]|nr:hypothetical protein AX16_000924 [Volvariella volvacea WC 439]
MRCNWSVATRIAFGNLKTSNARLAVQRSSTRVPLPTCSSSFTSSAVKIRAAEVVNSPHPPLTSTHLSTTSPQAELTPAQISRAAAQAVRLSIQQQSLTDAYIIVNSIFRASHPSNSSSGPAQPPKSSRTLRLQKDFAEFTSLFGRDVSPRLSSHALLHGLVRMGLSRKAFKLAKLMMENGVPVRNRTLETVVRTLVPLPSTPSTVLNYAPIRSSPLSKANTEQGPNKIRPAEVEHEGTRYALKLVMLARKTRGPGSDGLLDLLICACIINGEIIIASLLFGFLVKDLRHKTPPVCAENFAQEGDNSATRSTRFKGLGAMRKLDSPMEAILARINDALIDDSITTNPESRRTVLQALANLANHLDHRQLSTTRLAALIKTLYNCPRFDDDDLVTVLNRHGRVKVVKAYEHFNDVLVRLIKNLPSHPPIPSPPTSTTKNTRPCHWPDRLVPLDRATYNSLLHYALRHRLSIQMAEAIIDHMTTKRHQPLSPDTATFNILIRSATLLRNQILSDGVLSMMKQSIKAATAAPPPALPTQDASSTNPNSTSAPTPPAPILPVHADAYTISSYITHITSTGSPHLVLPILASQFPSFLSPLLPSGSSPTHFSQDNPHPVNAHRHKTARRLANREWARTGARLGPYFFTTVLNALTKARIYMLVQRVWSLAVSSERYSWTEDARRREGVEEGWVLPIQAYTIVMQAFEQEGKEKEKLFRELGKKIERMDTLSAQESVKARRALMRLIRARSLTKWGQYLDKYWARYAHVSPVLARRLVIKLYRVLKHRAANVQGLEDKKGSERRRLVRLKKMHLYPDTRLFNAAMKAVLPREVVDRVPSTSAAPHGSQNRTTKSARPSLSEYQKEYKSLRSAYVNDGMTPSPPHIPLLREVTSDLLDVGYDLPVGLRSNFIGTDVGASMMMSDSTEGKKAKKEILSGIPTRPYAYPVLCGRRAGARQKSEEAFYLPTWKTRGLPVRRKSRARRARVYGYTHRQMHMRSS